MYIFDFQSKLSRLNDKLYVDLSTSNYVTKGVRATSILYKNAKKWRRDMNEQQLQFADNKTQAFLKANYEGHMDQVVGATPTFWVPEHDVFDLESGTVIMRGWRTSVLLLVKRGLCSLDRAKRIFGQSLNEYDYDKLSYEQRLKKARGEDNKLSSLILGA